MNTCSCMRSKVAVCAAGEESPPPPHAARHPVSPRTSKLPNELSHVAPSKPGPCLPAEEAVIQRSLFRRAGPGRLAGAVISSARRACGGVARPRPGRALEPGIGPQPAAADRALGSVPARNPDLPADDQPRDPRLLRLGLGAGAGLSRRAAARRDLRRSDGGGGVSAADGALRATLASACADGQLTELSYIGSLRRW